MIKEDGLLRGGPLDNGHELGTGPEVGRTTKMRPRIFSNHTSAIEDVSELRSVTGNWGGGQLRHGRKCPGSQKFVRAVRNKC